MHLCVKFPHCKIMTLIEPCSPLKMHVNTHHSSGNSDRIPLVIRYSYLTMNALYRNYRTTVTIYVLTREVASMIKCMDFSLVSQNKGRPISIIILKKKIMCNPKKVHFPPTPPSYSLIVVTCVIGWMNFHNTTIIITVLVINTDKFINVFRKKLKYALVIFFTCFCNIP